MLLLNENLNKDSQMSFSPLRHSPLAAASEPVSSWPLNTINWDEEDQSPSSCPGTPEQNSFEEESNVFSTPKSRLKDSNVRASAPSDLVTPEKLRTAIHVFKEGEHALFSPLSKDKTKIDAGLHALHQMKTPDRKRKATELLENVFRQLAPDTEPNSVEFHEKAERTLQEDGITNTAKKIIRESSNILEKSPYRIVPLQHLTKRSKTGGFHLDLGNTDYSASTSQAPKRTDSKPRD